jgi:hypothetical protein
MSLIKRDSSEQRFYSLMLLQRDGNVNYYNQLFKNFRVFMLGMGRDDLVEGLEWRIKLKIEDIMGASIQHVLIVYKNLRTLEAPVRSKNPLYKWKYIRKYDLQKWLDEIERWCYEKIMEEEENIMFTAPPKFWT